MSKRIAERNIKTCHFRIQPGIFSILSNNTMEGGFILVLVFEVMEEAEHVESEC